VAKARERSPGADEGLLDRVLCVGAGAEHPQGDPIDAGLVPAHEFLERIDVTVLGRPNEDRVLDLAIHDLRLERLSVTSVRVLRYRASPSATSWAGA